MNTSNPIDWTQATAVLNVLYQYAYAYDVGDAQMMEQVFSDRATSGGVVRDSPSCWGPWSGCRAIADNLKALRSTQSDLRRHQITTPIFLELTPTRAIVKAYLSLFSTPPGGQPVLATTGEYEVHFSYIDDAWKIDRLDGILDGEF